LDSSVARNSFEQGLRLLPRCVGRACDLDLLRNLTEFPKQELTDDELREVKEAIESLGSEYVDSLKFRIMEFAPTNLGHPLRDLVLSIVNYPLARADSDSLSLLSKHLSKSGLAPDRLEITDEGQYAYILSSSVESLADQMEKEAFPFEIGLQFLAYRIMDPYSKDLIEDVPGIHILRIGLFEDSEPREFFLLFNLDQEGLEELRTISKRDD
jgi:hypothetical protein